MDLDFLSLSCQGGNMANKIVQRFFFMLCVISITSGNQRVHAQSAWTQFLHDARNTGRSEFTIPNKVAVKWKSDFALAAVRGLSVSHDNQTIYASSLDHHLYAVRSDDGLVLWKYLMDHALVGSPAVDAGGNIYIGSLDDYLYCLKPDGSLNWKVQLDADINSSPVIAPNNRVLIATQTRLYSYTFEGVPKWNYEITTYATPAVSSDGTVYIA